MGMFWFLPSWTDDWSQGGENPNLKLIYRLKRGGGGGIQAGTLAVSGTPNV